MRNIFLEKSYTECGGETIPRPSSKKSKLSIYLDRQSEIPQICFDSMPKSCVALSFILYKAFSKNKKRSGTSLPA